MNVNGKMILVESISQMGEGRIKENGGGMNSSTIYLIHCKDLCKFYNVYLPRTKMKQNKITIMKEN
jgi:hypothetical protein